MATVFANYAFDQSNLNLNRLYANSFDVNLIDDGYLNYNEVTYRDVYVVDWYLGGYYASAFGGDRTSVDDQLSVTGGMVSGYLELGWNGADYVELWGIQGVSIPAQELYKVAVTGSTGDEYSLINSALDGDDQFFLSDWNDVAFGRGGNDWMFGFSGHDVIFGGAGDDFLEGGLGNDTLDGGLGFDIAFFTGAPSSYTLTLSVGSPMVIADRRTGGDGDDKLIDVEALGFDLSSSTFDLTQFGGTTALSQKQFESFVELYIAYFNRAPDAVGLNFWGTAFANGTTFEEIAKLFMDQDETRATYPSVLSNTDFATAVYNNVLGRVPDQAGLDFWVGVLDSGGQGRDQFILSVLGGVQEGSADRVYLDNKVDVGAYFSVHRGLSDVGDAAAVMALFDGSQASIDRAVEAIEADYAEALHPTSGEFLMPLLGVLDNPFAWG